MKNLLKNVIVHWLRIECAEKILIRVGGYPESALSVHVISLVLCTNEVLPIVYFFCFKTDMFCRRFVEEVSSMPYYSYEKKQNVLFFIVWTVFFLHPFL